jgi:hypothetical protein
MDFNNISSAKNLLYSSLISAYPIEFHHRLQSIYNDLSTLEKIAGSNLLSDQESLQLFEKLQRLKDENTQDISSQTLSTIHGELQKILQKFQDNTRCKIIILVEQTLSLLQNEQQTTENTENPEIKSAQHKIQALSPERIRSLPDAEALYALKTLELFQRNFQRNTKNPLINQKNYEILNNLKFKKHS